MSERKLKEQIAVVSMGCVLPEAPNPEVFWQNVLNKKVSIGISGADRFDKEVHFRPETYGKTEKFDKTYTEIGSARAAFEFDGRRFRLPPTVTRHMDSNQKVMVLSAEQALSAVKSDSWNREKVSVFVGTTFIGELHHAFQRRTHWDRFSYHLKKHPEFSGLDAQKQSAVLEDLEHRFLKGTYMISEDSAPGILPNIIAARVSSVFDFHGHSYVLDAACASTLAAIIAGVQHLDSGESDVVICGGADLLNAELGRVYFSGINALSPDGSYPFDVRANGFVIGEGGGAVILKRYSDAIADGDQILALISGYGQNSDGKGKAIAAPNFKWQAKAIFDAFRMAGFSPDTVELIEAHGTATKVGDKSEIDAMKSCYETLGARRQEFCAVGSAKSNIGHLKAAAGVPGFIKTVMSLHHKVLPPTASCETINPALQLEGSPFFINTEKRDWPAKDHPRRAGVSGFGFGGANYHIVLEEFREADVDKKLESIRRIKSAPSTSVAAVSVSDTTKASAPAASISDESWLTLMVSGTDTDELCGELSRILDDMSDGGSRYENMLNLVLRENFSAVSTAAHRLGIAFLGRLELRTKIKTAMEMLSKAPTKQVASQWSLLAQKGIYYRNTPPVKRNEVAFLFPGQASQYPDMCLSLLEAYPHMKGFTVPMDSYWESHCGMRISELISSANCGVEATASLLKNTRNTHPALLYGSVLCHEILKQHGVEAGFMVGHSAGEISALKAAGMLNLKNALMLMDSRSRSFVEMPGNLPDGGVDYGKMAAVKTDREKLAALIAESGAEVSVANLNSPAQLIVSGFTRDMDAFLSFLSAQKIGFVELNVSHAFHSPVVRPAAEQYLEDLKSIVFRKGETPVYANETCTTYPEDPTVPGAEDQIRDILYRQMTGSVNYMGTIEKLANEEGVRLFVEVGPNQVLSQLTRAILDGKNVSIVPSNPKKKSDMEGMQSCIAALFAEGVAVQYVAPATCDVRLPADKEVLPRSPAPVQNVQVQHARPAIGYSGVSVGLPGSYKRSFRDDNFDQLFAGHNFIEALSEKEKSNLASLRVNKVVKTSQGPSFHLLDSLESVIQLAGKVGQIDALKDYQIDQSEIDQMNQAVLHGVAAGFEALRDARIPLVHQYNRTASGGLLPDRWVLPRSMQRRTGVIYAHGFPMVETVVAEVTRHLNYRFAGVGRKKQLAFYHQLLPLIENAEAKEILTNWFVENQAMLKNACSDDEVFKFNHLFINQISSLANVRMAQYIQALGPNFQLNAACSSTCTAITLSEEMIASGRVDRMLIIGSDDATSELSMPYLGAGFLSTGAASCESDVREAALPFDERRNGMIISAGAVSLVVERMDAAQARGVRPVCQLLGSHVFNTAGHHARLNVPRYADELKYFIDEMAAQYGLDVDALSKNLMYVSHETYTPARGGCSEAEAVSLRHVFKDNFRNILVTNTKGMTGHTMGASVEDVLAARALECGKVPPVVNFRVPDPKLEGLNLSRGGRHTCEFALRMAAGFGSQGNYILLRRYGDVVEECAMVNPLNPQSDHRIEDAGRYLEWLKEVSSDSTPELEFSGRLLRVKDTKMGAVVSDSSDVAPVPASSKGTPVSAPVSAAQPFSGIAGESTRGPATVAAKEIRTATRGEIQRLVFGVVAEITGYAPEMIEADMEVENDLGIDTVKQATILSTLGEKLGVADEFEFQIAAYPTVASWIDLFVGLSAPGESVSQTEITATMPIVEMEKDTVPPPSVRNATRGQIQELVFTVVSEITGYAPEMIEPDMEVENDLGIDTVKQATILSMLGEKLGVADEFEFQIAAYPTVASWIDLFMGLSPRAKESGISEGTLPVHTGAAQVPSASAAKTTSPLVSPAEIKEMVLDMVAEITGYAPEMIEPDMEVENDLGIDTVKQATILSMLGEKCGVADEFEFQIAAYPTIASWIDLFMGLTGAVGEADSAKAVASVETEPETDNATDLQGVPRRLSTHYLVREPLASETVTAILAKTTDLKSCRLFIIGPVSRFEMLRSRLHEITGELIHVDLSVNRIAEAVARVRSGGTLPLKDVWMDLSAYEIGVDVQEMLSAHFEFCKKLDDQRPDRIVSIGRKSPTHGALVGYYQALSKEWSVDYCGVMDGEAHSRISDTALATAIFALSKWPGAAVVEAHPEQILAWRAMDSDETTDTTDIVGATGAAEDIGWQDSDVLLVVGATGITARIAAAFSRKYPVKMALLDLNPLSETSYLGPEWDEENHPARKNDILERLQAEAEGGRVRPVALEQEFQRILKQRELQRNIRLLKDNNTAVKYLNCDVTDADAVKRAVNIIQQELGPITGIVHGAGIEISNLISKKTGEEFLKVSRPKIEGAENLLEFAASDRLKLWLCFSSISGVFGNAAQLDYSAANSFLNFITLSLQEQNPNVVARCIAWSGWAQTGMAWRNTYVRENAEKIGLHFIPLEEGCDKAVSLMSNTRGPSIQVVHKGLGHMLDNRWQPGSGFPTPLIDRMEKTESGFRFYKKLDVNTDEWLNQHRLLDTPLLPGVGYLEMMAEIYCRNNDFKNGICYENLAFHDAFKLTGEVPREIFIETSADAQKSGVPVSMKIFSEIKGRLFSDMRLYCTGTVSSAGVRPQLQEVWQEPGWTETADHFKVFEGIEKLPQNVIFGNLFHDFKREGADLDGMRYQWNDQALMRDYGFPMEQLNNPKYPLPDYRINFCLMDSLHQAGVVHTVLQTGKVHLPCGAGQFVIYDKCDSPVCYRNYARCVRREKDTFWYDIFLTNSRGEVCATVFGCEFRKIS